MEPQPDMVKWNLNENNPLRFSNGLDDSVVDQHYGEDPNGPRPMSDVEGRRLLLNQLKS